MKNVQVGASIQAAMISTMEKRRMWDGLWKIPRLIERMEMLQNGDTFQQSSMPNVVFTTTDDYDGTITSTLEGTLNSRAKRTGCRQALKIRGPKQKHLVMVLERGKDSLYAQVPRSRYARHRG